MLRNGGGLRLAPARARGRGVLRRPAAVAPQPGRDSVPGVPARDGSAPRPLNFLQRRGFRRGVATVVTVIGAAVVLGGLLTLVIIRAAEPGPAARRRDQQVIPDVKRWLITGPLRLNPTTVNNLSKTSPTPSPRTAPRSRPPPSPPARRRSAVLGGIALVIFSTIFLLYDGERVWSFLVRGAPRRRAPHVDAAGRAAWRTLAQYVGARGRGRLPRGGDRGHPHHPGGALAFPLAVLVGLGSFVPLVGAIVTGVLAVAVAGLSRGLVAAIIVAAVLVIDNQIEAHGSSPSWSAATCGSTLWPWSWPSPPGRSSSGSSGPSSPCRSWRARTAPIRAIRGSRP